MLGRATPTRPPPLLAGRILVVQRLRLAGTGADRLVAALAVFRDGVDCIGAGTLLQAEEQALGLNWIERLRQTDRKRPGAGDQSANLLGRTVDLSCGPFAAGLIDPVDDVLLPLRPGRENRVSFRVPGQRAGGETGRNIPRLRCLGLGKIPEQDLTGARGL